MKTGVAAQLLLALGLISAHALPASAINDGWLSEESARIELIGYKMQGYYRDGERWTDAYAPDGTIAYTDEHVAWTGEWLFQGNVFCTFYNDRADGGCYLMRQLSRNCFEYVIVPNDWTGPGLPEGVTSEWFARGWRSEHVSTCEEPPTV